MKVLGTLVSWALALGLSSAASADVWTDADSSFAQRENNRVAISQARNAYLAIADHARGPELVRAVAQLGRLAVYEGEMLLSKDDTNGRRKVFGDCWCKTTSGSTCSEPGFIEKIAPERVGPTPEYYYFKGICLAYWGEVANVVQQITWVPKLLDIVAAGRTQDMRFEGSGIDRLESGIRANVKARMLPGGIFNPALAVERAEEAINRPAYPGDPSSGEQYFENWRMYALALEANGQKDEARAVLDEKIPEMQDMLESSMLPRGREPESKWNLERMKEHRAALGD